MPFLKNTFYLLLLLQVASCGLFKKPSAQSVPETETQVGTSNNGGDFVGGYIASLKPALAVRATGCISCHSSVNANLITDFGYGDNYYFGQAGVPNLTEFEDSIYGDHHENWATAKVWGKIYVPNAPVTFNTGSSLATSLATYLNSVIAPPDLVTSKPEIVELNSVYIAAPTEDRILTVAGEFPVNQKWKYIPSDSEEFDGLELVSNGPYLRNRSDKPFICKGDLIVNEVLFLDHLQLETNDGGCRIYSTKTVFIQGTISYLGAAINRNLQITSSRAVCLGVGPGPVLGYGGSEVSQNSLIYRFQMQASRPGFFTREAGDAGDKLDTIVSESLIVSELIDAASQPEGRGVSFERLLINSPNFQSRYQGEFKGSIIAEIALGSFNGLSFKFDDVFSKTPILPLINETEILNITP